MLTMQVIGNVGKDPEVKQSQSGTKFANLTLASNKKVKGEKVTTWVSVTVFDENKIKFIESYVRKGTKLFLEGEPQARAYMKDGEAKSSLDLLLSYGSKMEICSSERADNDSGYSSGTTTSTTTAAASDVLDDDVPW
jgi:single-strand DNA-binding protein